jgi:hypothetical protein
MTYSRTQLKSNGDKHPLSLAHFHMETSLHLVHSKKSAKFRGLLKKLVTKSTLQWSSVNPTPVFQGGDHPLSTVRDYLFDVLAVTLHTWEPSPLSRNEARAVPCVNTLQIKCTVAQLNLTALCDIKISHTEHTCVRNTHDGMSSNL